MCLLLSSQMFTEYPLHASHCTNLEDSKYEPNSHVTSVAPKERLPNCKTQGKSLSFSVSHFLYRARHTHNRHRQGLGEVWLISCSCQKLCCLFQKSRALPPLASKQRLQSLKSDQRSTWGNTHRHTPQTKNRAAPQEMCICGKAWCQSIPWHFQC